ncbi:DUF3833 domain-containing protein [Pseudomonas aegrilactucae]|uniref:DUF3833 domain-containing protein n=1 Tax=Pseudomonas aegrilactucae TaxID=2854028 RepID=A0A9Q2XL75_9PSED|nr:DUF3833 domain-containing protein [Pseudomonas aegrilactucae]MBV6288194.1 DUF3833 domain-containing protein [Pseudomonas aegrilactucae]
MKRWCMLLCLVLAGCGNVEVETYRNQSPAFDLRQYFNGRVDGWGIVQKRSGEVIKRFHVVIDGRSDGENVVLEEHFTYSDGTRQERTWTIRPEGPGRWRGNAGDVVEEARGQSAGFALRWQYVLSVPVDGKTWDIRFDDWMYLLDENTLANRSYMTKFGFEVGQVTLFFRKQVQ